MNFSVFFCEVLYHLVSFAVAVPQGVKGEVRLAYKSSKVIPALN
jgi:hypothetical protein